MRYVWSLVMAAGLMMVQPSSADAQFSLSIGNPYYGNGITIGSPYGYGYNSFYNGGYGYGPGLYGSNFYGTGFGAPYLGGYGVTSYGYRGYSSGYRGYVGGYRPYGGYGYGGGYRGLGRGVPYGRFGGFRR